MNKILNGERGGGGKGGLKYVVFEFDFHWLKWRGKETTKTLKPGHFVEDSEGNKCWAAAIYDCETALSEDDVLTV